MYTKTHTVQKGRPVAEKAADCIYFTQNALETGDLPVMAKASSDDRCERVNDIFRYPEEEYYSRYERSAKNLMDVNPDGKAIEPIPLDHTR